MDAWKIISNEARVPEGVLTDRFVMRFDRYVDWSLLSRHYGLHAPLDVIRIYQHRFVWTTLLHYRLFTESFLREMAPNFDTDCWQVLSKHQKLSEEFIHDFASNVDWELITKYQDVSAEFITEHNIPMTSGASRSV